jgi:hypothetical protein
MAATGFFFLIGRFKKNSSLKPLGQINRNIVRSIYGKSSSTIAYFVMIWKQAWLPQDIPVSDWSISKKNIPLKTLGQMNQHLA